MEIGEIVITDYSYIDPFTGTDSIREKINQTHYMVLKENDEYKGFLSKEDLVKNPKTLVIDTITEKPSINIRDPIPMVLNLMLQTGNSALPVFKEDQFFGIITQSIILNYLSKQSLQLENKIEEQNNDFNQTLKQLQKEIESKTEMEKQIKTIHQHNQSLILEVHHRVNNNLQIISSLIDIISLQTEKDNRGELINEIQSKINSMAIIHNQCYQNGQFDRVHITENIKRIVEYIAVNFYEYTVDLNFELDEELFIPFEKAIPIALIFNEIITNAFKHAFIKNTKGKLLIQTCKTKDDHIHFMISDNGKGMPANFSLSASKHLGLKLVHNLITKQLGGQYTIEPLKPGTRISFSFP